MPCPPLLHSSQSQKGRQHNNCVRSVQAAPGYWVFGCVYEIPTQAVHVLSSRLRNSTLLRAMVLWAFSSLYQETYRKDTDVVFLSRPPLNILPVRCQNMDTFERCPVSPLQQRKCLTVYDLATLSPRSPEDLERRREISNSVVSSVRALFTQTKVGREMVMVFPRGFERDNLWHDGSGPLSLAVPKTTGKSWMRSGCAVVRPREIGCWLGYINLVVASSSTSPTHSKVISLL
jgi:hypothetical protein